LFILVKKSIRNENLGGSFGQSPNKIPVLYIKSWMRFLPNIPIDHYYCYNSLTKTVPTPHQVCMHDQGVEWNPLFQVCFVQARSVSGISLPLEHASGLQATFHAPSFSLGSFWT
jgi:hypothetical protein